ncbi:uncharacterized protein LOC110848834 [Folsomia candida]|nr:uncharacterized protein LOC110848834 [Folsomia candida]
MESASQTSGGRSRSKTNKAGTPAVELGDDRGARGDEYSQEEEEKRAGCDSSTGPQEKNCGDVAGGKSKIDQCGCPFKNDQIYNVAGWVVQLVVFGMAVATLLYRKSVWIGRQWAMKGEGHIVSKFVVILLFLHANNCLRWAGEVAKTVDLLLDAFSMRGRNRAGENPGWLKFWHAMRKRTYPKIVTNPIVIYGAVTLWNWVWINYVCKTLHDRSCTKTDFGKMLFDYRQEFCYYENTPDVMCDKLMASIPAILLTVGTSIMAYVIQYYFNRRLSNFFSARFSTAPIETITISDDEDQELVDGNVRTATTPAREVPMDEDLDETLDMDEGVEIEPKPAGKASSPSPAKSRDSSKGASRATQATLGNKKQKKRSK